MEYKKIDIILIVGIIISYTCFVISTFIHAAFWIDLFSPLTEAIVCITILCCLSRMGRFWKPSFLLAAGIFCYMFADILRFVGLYIIHSEIFTDAITFIYLLPNYFYGASVGLYFLQKLKGRDLHQFLINTFVLTVIGFIAYRRVLIYLGSYDMLSKPELIRIYLYFTINLFIIIMVAHMVFMIMSETGLKGTNTMILGILFYILLDIPYTYYQAIGQDPENIYTNLIYTLCMILMAHGIYHQVHHYHVFKLKAFSYTTTSARRTRLIILGGIILSAVLWAINIIDKNELFYLILVMLAYWITTTTFQYSALNEQLLKQQDILTGLYNRRYSSTLLSESVIKAREQGKRFAVFCIDLNSFKPINDTYGHDMGDRVLKEFGSRMLELPTSFTSFRTGGDEFMIIKDDLNGRADLENCAQKLLELFHTPLHLDTYIFSLSGSIGVAVYPDDATEPERLVRYSDAAMYAVKHSNNKDNYKFFDISLVESVEKHKALEEKLKNSDPFRDFVLHYQPRVDALSGKLIAAEVFPRLKDDNTYTAADLLPIAEEVGLMNRLGNWIIETSINQLKVWRKTYGIDISISINLSPLQLLDTDFLTRLKKLTSVHGLNPSNIHLDISNEAIMGASITAKETLRNLNEYGFVLALNDFGGDDINLSHIVNCGFSAIHISPSLIRKADEDPNSNILIESIIALANTMKIGAYAVGIETKEQSEKLKEMGVQSLQGFYYGKPAEAEAFEALYVRPKESDI